MTCVRRKTQLVTVHILTNPLFSVSKTNVTKGCLTLLLLAWSLVATLSAGSTLGPDELQWGSPAKTKDIKLDQCGNATRQQIRQSFGYLNKGSKLNHGLFKFTQAIYMGVV